MKKNKRYTDDYGRVALQARIDPEDFKALHDLCQVLEVTLMRRCTYGDAVSWLIKHQKEAK